MIEESDNINEFEQALRESLDVEEVKPGDVIEGTIVAVHGDVALVDVSGKSEAVLDRSELDDLGTGDPVEVVVISTGEELRVSRRMALEAKLKEKLNEAVASGEPVEGKVISNFRPNDPARKGIDIGGKEGQAIIASAGGEVVYSGSGLIGYGELIIIKHSESLLSAYAHNRKRLVSEGQKVTAGERIAEMGRNDRNQAMLHFEIRLNGNPQDPLQYLPRR